MITCEMTMESFFISNKCNHAQFESYSHRASKLCHNVSFLGQDTDGAIILVAKVKPEWSIYHGRYEFKVALAVYRAAFPPPL